MVRVWGTGQSNYCNSKPTIFSEPRKYTELMQIQGMVVDLALSKKAIYRITPTKVGHLALKMKFGIGKPDNNGTCHYDARQCARNPRVHITDKLSGYIGNIQ